MCNKKNWNDVIVSISQRSPGLDQYDRVPYSHKTYEWNITIILFFYNVLISLKLYDIVSLPTGRVAVDEKILQSMYT